MRKLLHMLLALALAVLPGRALSAPDCVVAHSESAAAVHAMHHVAYHPETAQGSDLPKSAPAKGCQHDCRQAGGICGSHCTPCQAGASFALPSNHAFFLLVAAVWQVPPPAAFLGITVTPDTHPPLHTSSADRV